jgi:hypothetical protein
MPGNSEAKQSVVRTELLGGRLQTNFDVTGDELLFRLGKLGGRCRFGLAGAQDYTECRREFQVGTFASGLEGSVGDLGGDLLSGETG